MDSAPVLTLHSESSADLLLDVPGGLYTTAKPNSRLNYTCRLDIDQVADNVRQTSIICTLGLFYLKSVIF